MSNGARKAGFVSLHLAAAPDRDPDQHQLE